MFELWVPISNLSAEGSEMTFNDQALWSDGWKAFGMDIRPGRDLEAKVTIMTQGDDAALIRGTLAGGVKLACDRCAEFFEHEVDIEFDAYEQLPDGEYDEEPRVRVQNGELQLNIGAVLWEEFALTLPVKPLCDEECHGVCPGCGQNLNEQACTCAGDEGDERLAVFRNLKIK